MTFQRTFWISGAATLAALLWIAGALLARSHATPPAVPTLTATEQRTAHSHHKKDRHERREEAEEDDD